MYPLDFADYITLGIPMQVTMIDERKYRKSALIYALALASTFLPLCLGIGDRYQNQLEAVGIGMGVVTVVNYLYLLLVKNSRVRKLSFLLIPVNIAAMFGSVGVIPFRIEGNVFGFGIAFLFFPWLAAVIFSVVSHMGSLRTSDSQ